MPALSFEKQRAPTDNKVLTIDAEPSNYSRVYSITKIIGGVMAELTIYEKYAKDGDAAMNAGNYREAEACWHTAMKIAEYFGERDPRLTESMEKLARVYSLMERNLEAEGLMSTAGKIRTRITGSGMVPQSPIDHSSLRVW